MITRGQLQRHAKQAGQNLVYFEIEVILTYLLQMLVERELGESLAFKGGTFLRKMGFGPGGRLSTDIDFTSRQMSDPEEILLRLMIAMDKPYRGLSFSYQKDKDLYVTEGTVRFQALSPVKFTSRSMWVERNTGDAASYSQKMIVKSGSVLEIRSEAKLPTTKFCS